MSGINRFLSRRDRHSSGSQPKKPRLIITDDPYGLFTPENGDKPTKDEEKKIKALQARLSQIGSKNIKEPQIEYALHAGCTDGDQDKAYDFLVIIQDSVEGIIREHDLGVKLLGAVNREQVTCWLDALLFAMFARLKSFETILYDSFDDQPRKRLATLLRLWVNMLRSGKLITTDITKLIQEALAGCGWDDAATIRQHDTSEAFVFIAEQLELPRLTLKMDLYHTGKEDATDDHKLINERLLQIAIPAEPRDGRAITLEDCLENYFNNRVEVRRHLERKGTGTSLTGKGQSVHIEYADVSASPSTPRSHEPSPLATGPRPPGAVDPRQRSSSIIRDQVVSAETESVSGDHGDPTSPPQQPRSRKGSIRKEVLMPAWQFFSLIPWYTDRAPTNDAQVAAQFSTERPLVGLCLKRYTMLPNGRAVRLNTFIDIPVELGLPHFIRDNDAEDDGPQFRNFKLSLQSAVCHRGISVESGHYVALVRSRSSGAASVNEHDPVKESPQGSDDRWMRFDDLASERVTYVDIQQALREESPYLLFYQVQPVEDPLPRSTPEPPPPYSAFTANNDHVGRPPDASDVSISSGGNHDRSQRASVDVPPTVHPREQGSTPREWCQSATSNDSSTNAPNPSIELGNHTSAGGPQGIAAGGDDLKGSSRDVAEEGRLSATFSRLAARISRDKLRTTDTKASSDGPPPSTADPTADEPGVSNARAPAKKSKRRAKSTVRGDGNDSAPPRSQGQTPERECELM